DLRLAHRELGVLGRDRCFRGEVRITLQCGELGAHFLGTRGRLGRRGTPDDERRGDCDGDEGSTVLNVHRLSPVLRCISSTRVALLRSMSAFTALAFTTLVFATASSASARASSASCTAATIFFSVTAACAADSLARASLSSAAAWVPASTRS